MSAKLTVIDGDNAGTELWIEYEVLRFGSDAGCELCLDDPNVEPHSLTIRYADGKYNVYNRGTSSVQLDAVTLAPSESGVWKPGKQLRTAGGLTLKLETSGNGAPERRPLDEPDEQPTGAVEVPVADDDVAVGAAGGSASKAAKAPSGKSNSGPLVAGLVFAAIAAFILLGDFEGAATTADGGRAPKTFAELIPALQKEPNCAPDLWIQFSQAYAVSYRGEAAEADKAFRRLRDRIEWEKNLLLSAGKPVPDALIDTEQFVKNRLLESGL